MKLGTVKFDNYAQNDAVAQSITKLREQLAEMHSSKNETEFKRFMTKRLVTEFKKSVLSGEVKGKEIKDMDVFKDEDAFMKAFLQYAGPNAEKHVTSLDDVRAGFVANVKKIADAADNRLVVEADLADDDGILKGKAVSDKDEEAFKAFVKQADDLCYKLGDYIVADSALVDQLVVDKMHEKRNAEKSARPSRDGIVLSAKATTNAELKAKKEKGEDKLVAFEEAIDALTVRLAVEAVILQEFTPFAPKHQVFAGEQQAYVDAVRVNTRGKDLVQKVHGEEYTAANLLDDHQQTLNVNLEFIKIAPASAHMCTALLNAVDKINPARLVRSEEKKEDLRISTFLKPSEPKVESKKDSDKDAASAAPGK